MISTLADILAESATKYPNKTALRVENSSLTFREVDEKCNQLAHTLTVNGIKKGNCVGIYLNRCIESFIAVHAILKLGAIFVPIDAKSPIARIKTIVEDCSIGTIITSEDQSLCTAELQQVLPDLNYLGTSKGASSKTWEEIFSGTNRNHINCAISSTDLAYIIFSSGSTGVPKGIVHTHYSGLSYAKQVAELYNLNETDRIVNHSALSSDISTLAYFASPMVGATTLLLSDMQCMVPASLSAFLEKESATVWYSVPLALKQLLNYGAMQSRNLSALRWILYAGEPIAVQDACDLIKILPQAMFSNIYGPTETNQCTFYNFKEIDPEAQEISLGTVWDAAEYLIIDENDKIITNPIGTGELVIHSSTTMKGYWKSKKPENEVFFWPKNVPSEKKYYRTGDIIRVDSQNQMFFIGRKDSQVKIQGYRVELKEIEHQLGRLYYLSDWAAIADKTTKDYAFIVVFVVLKNPKDQNQRILIKDHLKQFLPSFAVPEKIVILNEMPYANSGKKDYKKLDDYSKTNYEG